MGKSKPQAMPIFGDAYLADTTHLTTEEHGAYFLLMIAAWRQPNCDLPDDDHKLARIVGLTRHKWMKIRPTVIDDFWLKDNNGRLYQKRLQQEYDYVVAKANANSLNAKKRHRTGFSQKNEKSVTEKLKNNFSLFDDEDIENKQSGVSERTKKGGKNPAKTLPKRSPSTSTSTSISKEKTKAKDTRDLIENLWNKMAITYSLKSIRGLTAKRVKSLSKRLEEYSIEDFQKALELIPQSNFLMGKNDRGWKADFDFLLRPDSITKILEGKYENGEQQPTRPSDGFDAALDHVGDYFDDNPEIGSEPSGQDDTE